ncbi:nucleotidyltransferase family protein [uncultured Caulobacter sp.]|uniref:nucleotidyltransferase family protein n=1 Tax=uncultured Caulobacter sp. TaxID=158749 RepID=UPI00260D7B1C|nr:nucleotidyltransferase family protein [uncultured Caulobacter sp.]
MGARGQHGHVPHRRECRRHALQDLPDLREGSVSGFKALILAGSRGGEVDPAAAYAGVTHKGLIVLQGRTLLDRVLGAVQAAGAQTIGVSANDETIRAALAGANVKVLPPSAGPSQSVADGATTLGFPLVVTTVDHALLKPDWITQFVADTPVDADVAVLLASEERVQAAAPQTKRTYLKFRDGRYSGCNLFLLRNENALKVIAVWRKVEALRKQPWKIAAMLGPGFLIRYALGLLTLDEAVARLGRLADVKAAAVRAHDGLAAVDVDKPSDLDLVRELVGEA